MAAGEPGGVPGLAVGALGLSGAGGLGDERGRYWRWKTMLTTGTHLAARKAAGPSCRRRRREEEIRGRKDISPRLADWAPTWSAAVSCHVGKSGKNVRFSTIVVLSL